MYECNNSLLSVVRGEILIDGDHTEVIRIPRGDGFSNFFLNNKFFCCVFVRQYQIEDHVRVRGTGDGTQIVNTERGADMRYLLSEPCLDLTEKRIGRYDRIEMHDQVKSLIEKIAFDVIDHVVIFEYVALRRHFHVNGGELAARAVVVNEKIVRVKNAGIG